MLPVWLQVTLAVFLPLQSIIVVYLLATKTKRQEQAAIHQTAEITAESTFIGQLIGRIAAVETLESKCVERLMVLEGSNARLEVKIEALKHELAEKIASVESKVTGSLPSMP
jgi:hypothetical protein